MKDGSLPKKSWIRYDKIFTLSTSTVVRRVITSYSIHYTKLYEVKKSLTQDIDFEKLYAEFNVGEDMGDFLKNGIEEMIQPTYTENLFILPAGRNNFV